MSENGDSQVEDEVESGNTCRNGTTPRPKKAKKGPGELFACPFYKHDPQGHRLVEAPCTSSHGMDMSKLNQHISAYHHSWCGTCWKQFKDVRKPENLPAKLKNHKCEPTELSPEKERTSAKRMTLEQARNWENRKVLIKNLCQEVPRRPNETTACWNWRKTYKLLFPETTVYPDPKPEPKRMVPDDLIYVSSYDLDPNQRQERSEQLANAPEHLGMQAAMPHVPTLTSGTTHESNFLDAFFSDAGEHEPASALAPGRPMANSFAGPPEYLLSGVGVAERSFSDGRPPLMDESLEDLAASLDGFQNGPFAPDYTPLVYSDLDNHGKKGPELWF